jgi:hypothetical protein
MERLGREVREETRCVEGWSAVVGEILRPQVCLSVCVVMPVERVQPEQVHQQPMSLQ